MSFKLLAIRPLKDTSPNLLKGLKEDTIYKICNEYKYFDKNGNEVLSDEEVSEIKYDESIPQSFFGKNINITAIVGENGSGKSTLLELLYYFVYKYSVSKGFVELKKDEKSFQKLNLELFYLNEGNVVTSYKIKNGQFSYNNSSLIDSEGVYKFNIASEKASTQSNLDFYNIVLNYSIYGLNSNVSGQWLNSLFQKNDGYKTPIVVNPYREEGNIEINNEYLLAQSRLLMNSYVMGNETLIDDIHVSKVQFQLDVLKCQYINYYDEERKSYTQKTLSSVYTDGLSYFSLDKMMEATLMEEFVINKTYSYESILVITQIVKKVFEERGIIEYKSGRFIYKVKGEKGIPLQAKFAKDFIELTNHKLDFDKIVLKVLNAFYILKKVYKIIINYKQYATFKQLIKTDQIDIRKSLEISERELCNILSDYYYDVFNSELKIFSKENELDKLPNTFSLNDSDKTKFLRRFNARRHFIPMFFIDNFLVDLKNYDLKEVLYKSIPENIIKNIKGNHSINLRTIIDEVVDWNVSSVRKYDMEKDIVVDIDSLLSLLALKLKNDKSHITFKLKQAISYYGEGFFNNILSITEINELDIITEDNKICLLNIELNQSYLEQRTIYTMPLAFVQPTVLIAKMLKNDFDIISEVVNKGKFYDLEKLYNEFVEVNNETKDSLEEIRHEAGRKKLFKEGKEEDGIHLITSKEFRELIKSGALKEYPFTQLSSGEQQLIHSLLTLTYHIFNLKSVNSGDKFKYVNLIFDEIELYFHPEYQRRYIENLIKSLQQINEGNEIQFNVILSTHSPFILSDIPSQNVLKLKEGGAVSHDSINSFGANIHDLLADEFFLNNGFMGEFSSSKIKGLYDRIGDLSAQILSEDYYNQLRKEINLIGETVLRTPLLDLLDKEYQKKHTDNDYLIRHYEKIIQELNKK